MWFKDDGKIKCLSLSSYQLFDSNNRQIGKGGGVAIFVRKNVVKTDLQKFPSRNCQLLTIKIESKNYGKSNGFDCCIHQTQYKFIRILSKTFEVHFEKNDTKFKTHAFNVWRFQ